MAFHSMAEKHGDDPNDPYVRPGGPILQVETSVMKFFPAASSSRDPTWSPEWRSLIFTPEGRSRIKHL